MAIRKLKDWKGWWEGLRSKAFKAGAESLVTNIGALLGTNGVANLGIPGLADLGMNWKQALFTCIIQFVLRVLYAASQYVANKPDPDTVTEEYETSLVTKDSQGNVLSEATSKTVTTTPVQPTNP